MSNNLIKKMTVLLKTAQNILFRFFVFIYSKRTYFIVGLFSFSLIFIFQNCSNVVGFKPVDLSVQSSSSIVDSCPQLNVTNGTIAAFPSCAISCNSGYMQKNGVCTPIGGATTCSQNSVANGTVGSFPGCMIACDSGYLQNRGACISVVANSVCSQTTVNNGAISTYPSCTILCDLGFTKSGNSCVATTQNFSCIDLSLNLNQYYTDYLYKIPGLYGMFFGRLPEQDGLNFWMTNPSTAAADFAARTSLVSTYYPFYANNNSSDFISSIYTKNWGTIPDPGGLEYWTNKLSSSNPSLSIINAMYDAFFQTTCANQPTYALKNQVTVRQLTFINAIELGRYFATKTLVSPVTVGDPTYVQTQKWYADIISQTSQSIASQSSSATMQSTAAAILSAFKSQIDTWCIQDCTN